MDLTLRCMTFCFCFTAGAESGPVLRDLTSPAPCVLRLPLARGAGGWQHFDLQSELRLTFVYDTAILWRDGIGSPPEAELQGKTQTAASNGALLIMSHVK